MNKNKFRYCTLLLTDEYNHSRIFISEKNRYYIRRNNELIHLQILNEFKDIRKSYNKIDVIDKNNNYYKTDKSRIMKNCTILLIDNDNRSKIFISKKKLCYTSMIVIILMLMSMIMNFLMKIMNFLTKIMKIMII